MSQTPCRCKKPQECEECPEWIFTLADLLMCMMGLFVILWVLKPSPTAEAAEADQDWVKVAAGIREAFGYIPNPQSDDPVDIQMILNQLQRLKGPGEGGNTRLQPRGAIGTEPEVTSIRAGQQSVVGGRVLFASGSAELTVHAVDHLDQIARKIRGHRNIVLVKGHTSLDDLPDHISDQQKMDLSLRRAQAVADHLISRGVEADILRVQGCSIFEPVVQRSYGPDVQSDNRRVEVEATATLVGERQNGPTLPLPPRRPGN